MAVKFKTKRRLVASLVMGSSGFSANTRTFVDMSKIPTFQTVGMKSMLMKLEFELVGSFTHAASQPLLNTLFLKYGLNTELWGPGNFIISQDRRGWMDPIWEYAQRGRIDWIKGQDVAASTTSYSRTWTQEMDFEEPMLKSTIARCWPVEAFRAGNAGLYVTWKTPFGPIDGVSAVTTTALTINIYAHVFDIPASQLFLPILVREFAIKTDSGVLHPTPGIAQFLRCLLAESPVAADNDGTVLDDLSAITSLDYFGLPNAYTVYQQPTVLHMQDMNKLISTEQPSQLNTNTGNKSEFRLLDPQQNFDGHIRAIPLIWPDKGANLTDGPTYNDKPLLGINGDVSGGLPGNYWFLCQTVEPRTDVVLNATMAALTSSSSGQSLIGARAAVAPGYNVAGADLSRVPLLVNAS